MTAKENFSYSSRVQILLCRLSASSADAADPRNDRFAARSLIVISGKQKELTDFNKNQLALDLSE